MTVSLRAATHTYRYCRKSVSPYTNVALCPRLGGHRLRARAAVTVSDKRPSALSPGSQQAPGRSLRTHCYPLIGAESPEQVDSSSRDVGAAVSEDRGLWGPPAAADSVVDDRARHGFINADRHHLYWAPDDAETRREGARRIGDSLGLLRAESVDI